MAQSPSETIHHRDAFESYLKTLPALEALESEISVNRMQQVIKEEEAAALSHAETVELYRYLKDHTDELRTDLAQQLARYPHPEVPLRKFDEFVQAVLEYGQKYPRSDSPPPAENVSDIYQRIMISHQRDTWTDDPNHIINAGIHLPLPNRKSTQRVENRTTLGFRRLLDDLRHHQLNSTESDVIATELVGLPQAEQLTKLEWLVNQIHSSGDLGFQDLIDLFALGDNFEDSPFYADLNDVYEMLQTNQLTRELFEVAVLSRFKEIAAKELASTGITLAEIVIAYADGVSLEDDSRYQQPQVKAFIEKATVIEAPYFSHFRYELVAQYLHQQVEQLLAEDGVTFATFLKSLFSYYNKQTGKINREVISAVETVAGNQAVAYIFANEVRTNWFEDLLEQNYLEELAAHDK